MPSVLKTLAMNFPSFRRHMDRMQKISVECERLGRELTMAAAQRDELAEEVFRLSRQLEVPVRQMVGDPHAEWAECKRRKQELSAQHRAGASSARLTPSIQAFETAVDQSRLGWIKHQVDAEPYWFQRIEVLPGLFSSGWSDPAVDKLPYYGLPADLTGKRVLDIGCAEGFFSFEAERRGAREVIGIDSAPDSIRRFNITKAARQSNASAFLMNVYDLDPRRLGTFDLVLFYGVFYHLKHPQHAMERIRSICTGDLLFQTHMYEEPAVKGIPWARFYPHGKMSGQDHELFDPTVFWLYNSACCLAMLDHVGFVDSQIISTDPHPFVVSARIDPSVPGAPPDQSEAPWC